MKVVLTGPCGRIGVTTFKRLLDSGHQVRGFDTKNDYVTHTPGFNEKLVEDWKAEGLDFEWVWGDLRNPEAVRRAVGDDADVVIHLGAVTMPNHCEEHWKYAWEVNYFGTRRVIDAMRRSPRKPKLVFPSSVAVYGITPPPRPLIKEDEPLISCCTYGATKIAAELEIEKSDLRYTILRMASSITPSARHLMMLANSEDLSRVFTEYMKLMSYESPMHLVSNYDTNSALLNSMDDPDSDGRIFNVAGTEDCMVTFGKYYDAISELGGRPPPPREAYGTGPYPQYYYDTTAGQAALKFQSRSFDDLLAEIRAANAELALLMGG
jgi:nucleoside-diphosphate-sugar epimerase